jgi:hypothetical protein
MGWPAAPRPGQLDGFSEGEDGSGCATDPNLAGHWYYAAQTMFMREPYE